MPDFTQHPSPGRLIYLMGASGAGKDSLIEYLMTHLPEAEKAGFAVARRYLTRPVTGNNPYDLSISPAEFARRRADGFFAMAWESYNSSYGIGREIDSLLERGLNVIVNGSRRYHAEARRRYPKLISVLVRADPGLRRCRLESRQRDQDAELQERLATEDSLFALSPDRPETFPADFMVITNNGPLAAAGEEFLSRLRNCVKKPG